jgi:hypothetical protein
MRRTLSHLEVLHREVDNRGILLHEPVVLGKALEVYYEVTRQSREDILLCFVFDRDVLARSRGQVDRAAKHIHTRHTHTQ